MESATTPHTRTTFTIEYTSAVGSAASSSRAGDAWPVPAMAQKTATELTAARANIAQLKSSLRHSKRRRCGR